MANNDFPWLNINIEELRAAVEILLVAANEYAKNMGAVNWGDLGVHDIECRLSMLTHLDPYYVVMIAEASPDCRLPAFLYDNLDREKFPGVFFECAW